MVKHADDFGDDPDIRRKYGEDDFAEFNKKEPWERKYRGVFKKKTWVKPHTRKVNGKTVHVSGHPRKINKEPPKYAKNPKYKKYTRRE